MALGLAQFQSFFLHYPINAWFIFGSSVVFFGLQTVYYIEMDGFLSQQRLIFDRDLFLVTDACVKGIFELKGNLITIGAISPSQKNPSWIDCKFRSALFRNEVIGIFEVKFRKGYSIFPFDGDFIL